MPHRVASRAQSASWGLVRALPLSLLVLLVLLVLLAVDARRAADASAARALDAGGRYLSRMTERIAQVLELADSLSLTTEERVELIERLEDTVEPAAAASTWTPELERRAREALRGENLVGEASEVLAQIREELRAAR